VDRAFLHFRHPYELEEVVMPYHPETLAIHAGQVVDPATN